MQTNPRDDPADSIDDDSLDRVLDRGFQAAGDEARRDDPSPAPSVIQRIARITGQKPKVSLRDAEQQGQTPMLKPLGPDDAHDAGKYVIQGELGSGGVGAVHKGHDQDLGRDVAMKFLHDRYKDEPTILQRFVEEAQIGGQLQHPGIVPVYDLGMVGDQPFFAMKLVKGQTLAKKLADRESATDDRRTFLAIFEDVCQTLAYAHVRGVVHRDLKPANIMIGSFGEVQVVDWGMGKVMQSGGVHDEKRAAERQPQLSVIETVRSAGHGTQSIMGSVMGTPAYMPPEQARGDVEAMDERSDVFALGAILCEILTGQPPYVGESDLLIGMAAMAELEDAHARLAACAGEPEMVELTTRCLMPAPAARPKSAEVVAKAVHDHLAAVESRVHEARVEAAEAKVRATALKRTQTLGIGLTAVIAAGLLVSLWFWRAADTAATNEGIARDQAVASAKAARANERLAVEQTEVAERELSRTVEIKRLITEMLESVTPEQAKGADLTLLRGIIDTASKRLTEDAIEDELVAAELHALTGKVYLSIGLFPEAELHLPVATMLRRRVLGEEHPDTLASMQSLANLYSNQARYTEAEPLMLQTIDISKRVRGEEHRSTLVSMSNLAQLYGARARYAEAATLALQTLKVQKRVLGEEHPDTLQSMGQLANLYQLQGRYTEAVALNLQTVELSKRVLGEEHPSTLMSMGNLASLYQFQGRIAEAEPLVQLTLEIRKRVRGREHPNTLWSMHSLAGLYVAQSRYTEAESLFLQTLEIQKRVLGKEHPSTLESLTSLAALYNLLGRRAEAVTLGLQTLEVQKRVLGEEHPNTLRSMGQLTNLYQMQGRLAEATTLGLQTLEVQKRMLGEEHPDTLRSMAQLANLYQMQGRAAEAVALGLQTQEIRKRVLGEEHADTLQGMDNLATIYSQQGRHAEAEPLYLRVLKIRKRVLGEDHPATLGSIGNLANLYKKLGRYAEAKPLMLQTIETLRRLLGEEHPNTLGMLTNLGHLYNSMERFEAAAKMFEVSLPIKRRVLGLQHPWTGFAMQGLATAYLGLGRTEDAVPLQREVIALRIAAAEAVGASAAALSDAADTLLTVETKSLRDPERALGFAKRACALETKNWKLFRVLALAQHETGDTAAAGRDPEASHRADAQRRGSRDGQAPGRVRGRREGPLAVTVETPCPLTPTRPVGPWFAPLPQATELRNRSSCATTRRRFGPTWLTAGAARARLTQSTTPCQDIFVECIKPGGALEGADPTNGEFRGLLYAVVRNVARRYEERAMRPGQGTEGSVLLDDLPDRAEALSRVFDRSWAEAIVRDAILRHARVARHGDSDTRRRYRILRLRHQEGVPIREIAVRLDVASVEVAHNAYRRARREFREHMREGRCPPHRRGARRPRRRVPAGDGTARILKDRRFLREYPKAWMPGMAERLAEYQAAVEDRGAPVAGID